MKLRNAKTSILLSALLVGTLSGSVALCQPPPPSGFGGPGGPGQGRPPMGGPRTLSPAQVPVSALAAALELNATQKTKVQEIQNSLKQLRESLMPRPGQNNGVPPDRETMQANFERLRRAEQKANRDIEALLTANQKQALPAAMKLFNALREEQIPLDVYAQLNLAAAQKRQLVEIFTNAMPPRPAPGEGNPGQGRPPRIDRRQLHEQAMEVLTEAQRQIVEAWIAEHPRPEGGRPGGPGGPGGRGGFGGPPPFGGEGGPPPPPPGGEPPLL